MTTQFSEDSIIEFKNKTQEISNLVAEIKTLSAKQADEDTIIEINNKSREIESLVNDLQNIFA